MVGAIRQCCGIMGLDVAVYSYRRTVEAVFIAFLAAVAAGRVYDGHITRNDRPDKQYAPLGSVESEMIATCMEDGFGIKNTTMMVNAHRVENGDVHVGESAVYNGYTRMQPIVTKIQKHAQAGGPAWENANWCYAYQKAVRFGLDVPTDKQYEPWGDDEPTPAWASRERMEENKCTVVQGQILAADEVHVKVCHGGKMRHALRSDVDIRFARNPETGCVDTSIDESGEPNGVFREAKTNLHAKYDEEARFCYIGATPEQFVVNESTGLTEAGGPESMKPAIAKPYGLLHLTFSFRHAACNCSFTGRISCSSHFWGLHIGPVHLDQS